jgi:hypothetical protein
MPMKTETFNGKKIAFVSEEIKLNAYDEFIDLLGNANYQGATGIIIRQAQLPDGFFDLKTGVAGEILQKFSNYRMKLSIIGDFSIYSSKSLKDFIFESNKQGHISFTDNMENAIRKLSNS